MEKTKNYDLFKLRDDNRDKINYAHVKDLVNSIKTRNMLDMRPIDVNEEFEIIDGQHRFLAAKELGVYIYYNIDKKFTISNMLLLNTAKSWKDADYLNYYLKNGKEEYAKLKTFMVENKLDLRVALTLTRGSSHEKHKEFRGGDYVFENDMLTENIWLCKQTVQTIKQMNGHAASAYTRASRFWKALARIFVHPDFEASRWFTNLPKFCQRISAKATEKDYFELFREIYNYRSQKKITEIEEMEKII